jgi:DNA-binding transcriptional LysR family regulator
VVEAGGYAQAAEALHKSQSAVTYAVQKIESQLGVRPSRSRAARRCSRHRAHALPAGAGAGGEAGDLEQAARKLSAGWEAEIGLAVEVLFPPGLLLMRWPVLAPRRRGPGSR